MISIISQKCHTHAITSFIISILIILNFSCLVVSQDACTAEAYLQASNALAELSRVSDVLFARIGTHVAAEHARLGTVSARLARAGVGVQALRGSYATRATCVYSPAKFPSSLAPPYLPLHASEGACAHVAPVAVRSRVPPASDPARGKPQRHVFIVLQMCLHVFLCFADVFACDIGECVS